MKEKISIEAIKELKNKSGLTNSEVSALSGVPYGTVNKILSGGTKSVKTETYFKILNAIKSCSRAYSESANNFGFYGAVALSPKVALACPNENAETVINEAVSASERGANIILFPELYLTGATLGSLYSQSALLEGAQKALIKVCKATSSINAVIAVGLPMLVQGGVYNCVAVIYKGDILGFTPKTVDSEHFSGYKGNFDSAVFNGKSYPFGSIVYRGGANFTFAVSFLEEIYLPVSTMSLYAQAGANAVLVPYAKNETMFAPKTVTNLLVSESERLSIGVISACVGYGESTTDGVYSARCLIAEKGELLCESKAFSYKPCFAQLDFEFLAYEKAKRKVTAQFFKVSEVCFSYNVTNFTLERAHTKYPFIPKTDAIKGSINAVNIQARALAQRLNHIHAENLVLGISGGLDSTLAILVAVKAVAIAGKSVKNVIAITMPCFGTSSRTKNNAVKLCELLGVTLKEINIKNAVNQHFIDIGQNPDNADITYENSQARERTQVLMDIANKVNGIVVGTGDLSELALGWATFNGDHMSNYSVNASIPKTLVKEIVISYGNHLGGEIKEVLFDIADTPVSPELKPLTEKESSQKTEDIVGPYILHDYFIYHSLARGASPRKIYEMAKVTFKGEFDSDTILKWLKTYFRRFFYQQFKRSCVPDGVMVTELSLSPRTSLKMPSDANPETWLKELEI